MQKGVLPSKYICAWRMVWVVGGNLVSIRDSIPTGVGPYCPPTLSPTLSPTPVPNTSPTPSTTPHGNINIKSTRTGWWSTHAKWLKWTPTTEQAWPSTVGRGSAACMQVSRGVAGSCITHHQSDNTKSTSPQSVFSHHAFFCALFDMSDAEPIHPLDIIVDAWTMNNSIDEVVGSSTICVATLDHTQNQLSYANLGDCGLMVIRHIDSEKAGYMR